MMEVPDAEEEEEENDNNKSKDKKKKKKPKAKSSPMMYMTASDARYTLSSIHYTSTR